MNIDLEQRTARIGVRELIGPEATRWDVPWLPKRGQLGTALHSERRRLREQAQEGYLGEHAFVWELLHRDYRVKIQGRIDGLYPSAGGWVVEEVKSMALESGELGRLTEYDLPAARMQLLLYLHVLSAQGYGEVRGELVICSLFERTLEYVLPIRYDVREIERFLLTRLDELLDDAEARAHWLAARRALVEQMHFPYDAWRDVQVSMFEEASACFQGEGALLMEAPTGTGKTAVSLYAALKYALAHDLKIFFVTAKTSGQSSAQVFLRRMMQSLPSLRALTLTSREKLCPHPVVYCHPDFCPHAREYVERVRRSQILPELLSQGLLDRSHFAQAGEQHLLCPFELSLELLDQVDVVICDYNYVFSPTSTLRRIFVERPYDHHLLIIDEAHNLLPRAREYYSPLLSWRAARLLEAHGEQRLDASGYRLQQLALNIQEYLWTCLSEAGLTEVQEGTVECAPDVSQLIAWRDTLEALLLDDPLRRKIPPSPGQEDIPLAFYRQLHAFTEVARTLDTRSTPLIEREQDEARLRILCHDPSKSLHKRLEGFHAVLAMSATLTPTDFYRQLLGFEASALSASFPSPFPRAHRGVFIVGDIDDRYHERPAAIPKLRKVVQQVLEAHPGCYALYLPSFEFLKTFSASLNLPDYELLVQDARMDDGIRAAVMRRLAMPLAARGLFRGYRGRLLLAVQGGSFAEGIEWPEGVLSGIIIVSPGLPRMDVDQELHRRHFDEQNGQGFEYTYLYPGMAKVIQAAGRLIRREEDRGVVVLVGKRFLQSRYAQLLPREWYDKSPAELETEDLAAELQRFWTRMGS